LSSADASANAVSLTEKNRPRTANSTLTSKSDASQEPTPSLWKEAFDKLSDDDKKSLPFTDDDRCNYLEKVLERTVESRDACQEKGLKFEFGEKTFVVRDLADKILSWVEKFKEVGDIAVQYDPGHAALPWAGVRLLLQLALTESENMKAAVFGVEKITRLLLRCKAYERYYMQPDPKPFNHTSLADILTQLYTAVLVFLASSKRAFDPNPIRRVDYGLLDLEGLRSRLDSIEEHELSVEREMRVADMESKNIDNEDLKNRVSNVQQVLDYLSEPIIRTGQTVQKMHKQLEGCTSVFKSSMWYRRGRVS